MAPIKMVKIVHCICVIALLLLARADAFALSSLSMAADSGRIRRLPLVAGNWKVNALPVFIPIQSFQWILNGLDEHRFEIRYFTR